MANTQERAELHKTIWKIANDLRGSVDSWDFKAFWDGTSRGTKFTLDYAKEKGKPIKI